MDQEDREKNESDDDDPDNDDLWEWVGLHIARFFRVLMDEAHACRNTHTRIARSIRETYFQVIWFFSATPMLNRCQDLASYLSFLWRIEWEIPGPGLGKKDLTLYDDDNLPPGDLNDRANPSPYAVAGPLSFPRWQQELWRMDPQTFWTCVRSSDDTGKIDAAFRILRPILPLLMLRRTQAEWMEVNGKQVRLGDSIPGYHITTVELDWPDDYSYRRYNGWHKEFVQETSTSSGSATAMAPVMKGRNSEGQSVGTQKWSAYRKFSILTMNPACERLLARLGSQTLVDDVEKWYTQGDDRGMSWYYNKIKPEYNSPLYADRLSFVRFLTKDSPKLQYLVKLMGEIVYPTDVCPNPGRALIYTDWPVNSFLIEGVLHVRPWI